MFLTIDEKLFELFGIFSCRGIIDGSDLIISLESERGVYVRHVSSLMLDIFKILPEQKLGDDKITLIISNEHLVNLSLKISLSNQISNNGFKRK